MRRAHQTRLDVGEAPSEPERGLPDLREAEVVRRGDVAVHVQDLPAERPAARGGGGDGRDEKTRQTRRGGAWVDIRTTANENDIRARRARAPSPARRRRRRRGRLASRAEPSRDALNPKP
eukprot:30488-Pelagococcus_subviridis.AAC.3